MINKRKIAVIQFPGSNTELETIAAIKRGGMVPVSHLWNEPPSKLKAWDILLLVVSLMKIDQGLVLLLL